MEQIVISFKDLNAENVWNLSEEEVFEVMQTVQNEVNKEERSPYMRLISIAFDFRSISPRRKDLRADLEKYGFKFFKVEGRETLTGIRKLHPKKNFTIH